MRLPLLETYSPFFFLYNLSAIDIEFYRKDFANLLKGAFFLSNL